jgi:hypothetical protein
MHIDTFRLAWAVGAVLAAALVALVVLSVAFTGTGPNGTSDLIAPTPSAWRPSATHWCRSFTHGQTIETYHGQVVTLALLTLWAPTPYMHQDMLNITQHTSIAGEDAADIDAHIAKACGQ